MARSYYWRGSRIEIRYLKISTNFQYFCLKSVCRVLSNLGHIIFSVYSWVSTLLQLTLREEIFAGINCREFSFIGDFAGINFCELSLTKNFEGINFRESALFKDFARVNLTFALRNIFSTALVYGFEDNLSKN